MLGSTKRTLVWQPAKWSIY